jgi:hypothetical protein
MKTLLMLLGAFATVVTLYGAGFATAISFLHAEPVATWKPGRDTAQAWTLEPVRAQNGDEGLERLPARSRAPSRLASDEDATDRAETTETDNRPEPVDMAQPDIDTMTTAALQPDEPADEDFDARPEPKAASSEDHVRWCRARYRSYDVEDNSYRPYSGGTRACISPYSDVVGVARSGNRERRHAVAEAAGVQRAEPGLRRVLTIGHVRACAERYRSYRVSDNSYQPYGGGPRRQCR